jgi:hypothetical protein
MKKKAAVPNCDKLAFDWWRTEGIYIDPDTEEIDWHDKRAELAQIAFVAGWKAAQLAPK